jgi:hypothetical protein
MNDSELATFKKMFQKYHEHISKHKDSLIARIYGIFIVKMEDIVPVNLILMGNTITANPKEIECIFDLKGSIINREVKISKDSYKPSHTLKDVNLLDFQKEKIFLRFSK